MPEDERYTMTWSERKASRAVMLEDVRAIKDELLEAYCKGSEYFSKHAAPKLEKFMALNSFAILDILDDALAIKTE